MMPGCTVSGLCLFCRCEKKIKINYSSSGLGPLPPAPTMEPHDCWLAGCLLAGMPACWLAGLLAGLLPGAGLLAGWLACWLAGLLAGLLAGVLAGLLACWNGLVAQGVRSHGQVW